MKDEDEKSYCYIDHANKKSEIYHSSPQLYRFNQKRKKQRQRGTRGDDEAIDQAEDARLEDLTDKAS